MGQEPWLNYIMRVKYTDQSRPITESNHLLQACKDRGIIAERLFGEKEILIDSQYQGGESATWKCMLECGKVEFVEIRESSGTAGGEGEPTLSAAR